MNDNRNIPDKERRAPIYRSDRPMPRPTPQTMPRQSVQANGQMPRPQQAPTQTMPRQSVQANGQMPRPQQAPTQTMPRQSAEGEAKIRRSPKKDKPKYDAAKEKAEKKARLKEQTAQKKITDKKTEGEISYEPKKNNAITGLFSTGLPHNEWTRPARNAKKIALAAFAVLSVVLIVLSVNFCYSYSGESIRIVSESTEATRSSARAYRIVYSESDPFGLSAATALHDAFLEKTGASLEIKSDAESVSQHEIRIGHTNRATDDYLTSVSTLGADGYAVLVTSSDSVNLISFSEAGANAAIKYFISNYVGAYRRSELTFASRNNFSLVSRDGNEPDVSLRTTKVPLTFTESGKFRILVLSDADLNPNTPEAVEVLADEEKPQLVIFAGDVSSGIATKAELEDYIKTLTAPLEERKIPWAVTFGEQDTDAGLGAEAQADVYMAFPYCVMKKDFTSDGAVSYFLPIYEAGEVGTASVPVFGAFLMGQTAMLSSSGNGSAREQLFDTERVSGTDYGYVTANHIAWFVRASETLCRESGGTLPTVMITHTPTPEFAFCAKEQEKTKLSGNVGEDVASSPVNSGLFASLLDCGNVLGLYVGHDHLNTFSAEYCGIELAYSGSIGYDGYGLGGTFRINNSLRGGRIIELTLRDGKVRKSSRMVYTSDFEIGEG